MASSDVSLERTDVASSTAGLVLSGVTKAFPGVLALDDVSLTVVRGEVHGVVGENGAGKSTLMAVASGALAPDAGSLTIGGRAIDADDPDAAREAGLAIVRQEPALLPDLSVAENLYLGVPEKRRPPIARMEAWASDVLAAWGQSTGIDPSYRVEQLIPQQRFIVDLCRAFAQEPDVLVLDEPTEHLLREEVETLFGHLRRRAQTGMATVYISHRINEVKQITDRLTVLRNGRAVGTFRTDEADEQEIVGRIIGRNLDAYFPDKAAGPGDGGLKLRGFRTDGIAELDIDLPRGQIIGLAGIEGNGQRDFIRALAALQRSGGTVETARGLQSWNRRSAARTGVVFVPGDRHREGILPSLNVRENVAYRNLSRIAAAGWVTPTRDERFARAVVTDYRVKTPSAEAPIESLSGGNQQKALIGAALESRPAVLLLDEPTQGVDIGARSDIYGLLRRAADSGAVVVVLSSDAVELAGIADRVLVFSRGQIIEQLEGGRITERAITASSLNAQTERIRTVGRQRMRALTWLAGDTAPSAILGVLITSLVVVGALVQPRFIGEYNVASILALTAVLGFVAFGQLLVLLTGGIDISAGPVVGLVVNVASYYLVVSASPAELAVGWVLMFGAALLVGLINWALIEFVKLNPLIATLATFMAIQGVSFVLRPSPGGSIRPDIISAVTMRLGPIPLSFVLVLLVGIVLGFLLKRSRNGIILRAVGSDSERSRLNGAHPRLVRLGAYLGCSFLAAVAGVFFMAQTGTGDARGGLGLILLSITAAVVGGASLTGGRGSFLGALLGALLVQVISSFMVFLQVSSDAQYYVIGVITIGAVALYSLARRRVAVKE